MSLDDYESDDDDDGLFILEFLDGSSSSGWYLDMGSEAIHERFSCDYNAL